MVSNLEDAIDQVMSTPGYFDAVLDFSESNLANYQLYYNSTDLPPTFYKSVKLSSLADGSYQKHFFYSNLQFAVDKSLIELQIEKKMFEANYNSPERIRNQVNSDQIQRSIQQSNQKAKNRILKLNQQQILKKKQQKYKQNIQQDYALQDDKFQHQHQRDQLQPWKHQIKHITLPFQKDRQHVHSKNLEDNTQHLYNFSQNNHYSAQNIKQQEKSQMYQQLQDDKYIDPIVHLQLNPTVKPFPWPTHQINLAFFSAAVAIVLLVVFSFLPLNRLIVANIVREKEQRLREAMLIYGLQDFMYWSSWFLTHLCIVLISSIVCAIVCHYPFPSSSFICILAFFLTAGVALISFSYFICSIFQTSRVAGPLSTIFYTATMMPGFILYMLQPYGSPWWEYVCIFPSSAYALFTAGLLKLERTQRGFTFSTINLEFTEAYPFTLNTVLRMLLLDSVLYLVLAVFLEWVFPKPIGYTYSLNILFKSIYESIASLLSPYKSEQQRQYFQNASIQRNQTLNDNRPLIDIMGLWKSYPSSHALNGNIVLQQLNLKIKANEVVALLGHNGAGKTTLIQLLTGMTLATGGNAYINHFSIQSDMHKIRRSIGVAPQFDILWPELTVKEHLEFYSQLKGLTVAAAMQEAIRIAQNVNLFDKLDFLVEDLAQGEKRKLSVGIAFVGDPKVVILDEPTSGMDPFSRRYVWDIIDKQRQGKAILFSTHYLEEADLLSDKVAILRDGFLIACKSLQNLKNQYGQGYTLVLDKHSDINAGQDSVPTTPQGQYTPNQYTPTANFYQSNPFQNYPQMPSQASSTLGQGGSNHTGPSDEQMAQQLQQFQQEQVNGQERALQQDGNQFILGQQSQLSGHMPPSQGQYNNQSGNQQHTPTSQQLFYGSSPSTINVFNKMSKMIQPSFGRIEVGDYKIAELISRHIKGATLLYNQGQEIAFRLPKVQSQNFPVLIRELDQRRQELRIGNFMLSMMQLEDILLNLVRGQGYYTTEHYNIFQQVLSHRHNLSDSISDPQSDQEVDNSSRFMESNQQQLGHVSEHIEEQQSISLMDEEGSNDLLQGNDLWFQQFRALFYKRATSASRDYRALFVQILVPILFVVVALVVGEIKFEEHSQPPLTISRSNCLHNIEYPWGATKELRNHQNLWSFIQMANHTPYSLVDTKVDVLNTNFLDRPQNNSFDGYLLNTWFRGDQSSHRNSKAIPRYDDALFFSQIPKMIDLLQNSHPMDFSILMNESALYALPASLQSFTNMLYQTIDKIKLNFTNYKISNEIDNASPYKKIDPTSQILTQNISALYQNNKILKLPKNQKMENIKRLNKIKASNQNHLKQNENYQVLQNDFLQEKLSFQNIKDLNGLEQDYILTNKSITLQDQQFVSVLQLVYDSKIYIRQKMDIDSWQFQKNLQNILCRYLINKYNISEQQSQNWNQLEMYEQTSQQYDQNVRNSERPQQPRMQADGKVQQQVPSEQKFKNRLRKYCQNDRVESFPENQYIWDQANSYNQEKFTQLPVSKNSDQATINQQKEIFDALGQQLQVTYVALPQHLKYRTASRTQDDLFLGLCLTIAISILSATFSIYLVRERSNNSKHVQLISGASPIVFWVATYAWDMISFSVSCCGILVMCTRKMQFTGWQRLGAIGLLMFFVGLSSLPLTYVLQFSFTDDMQALYYISNLSWLIGYLGFLTTYMFDIVWLIIRIENVHDWNRFIQKILQTTWPHYCFSRGIYDFTTYQLQMPGDSAKNDDSQNTSSLKQLCIDMTLQAIFYSLMTVCIDRGVFLRLLTFFKKFSNGCKRYYKKLIRQWNTARISPLRQQNNNMEGYISLQSDMTEANLRTPSSQITPQNGLLQQSPGPQLNIEVNSSNHINNNNNNNNQSRSNSNDSEDLDVMQERVAVLLGTPQEWQIVLREINKSYDQGLCQKPITALKNITFGVGRRECFSLLGTNGAGKSTIFRILTGEITPDGGDAFVCAQSIIKKYNKARKHIGYCPQLLGLHENLTVREALTVQGMIRGIQPMQLQGIVEQLIAQLSLRAHSDLEGWKLSGGNQRKLSLAMALVGNPPVLLLDEPSSGMDPVARRDFQQVLLQQTQHQGQTVIISSQNMSEAENIATRIGIINEGKMSCLGTAQHLKNQYGRSYFLQVKVKNRNANQDLIQIMLQYLRQFAKYIESHADELRFSIDDQDSRGAMLQNVFTVMEKLLNEQLIVDYQLTKTTLDYIFYDIAKKYSQ